MKYLFLSILVALLFSCEAEKIADPVISDELIIGLSYGECGGDCAFLYQLRDNNVYPDQGVDLVWSDVENLSFSSVPISTLEPARYDSLFNQLPAGLDSYETSDFGCPDCGDWGSLHIIRETEAGAYVSYVLDNQTGSMAAGLQPYGRLIQRSLVEFRR